MALGQVGRTAREQPEALIEPRQDRLRCEHGHARRRKLDGERQTVQPCADLGDRGGVLGAELEARPHGHGARDEELDGAVAQCLAAVLDARFRQAERRHLQAPLVAQAQGLAARDEELHARRLREQLGQAGAGRHDLLHVVEDQEHLLARERARERLQTPDDAERLADRREHVRGIRERRE